MSRINDLSKGRDKGTRIGFVVAISFLFVLFQIAFRLVYVQRLSFAEEGVWDAVSLLPYGNFGDRPQN